MSGVKRIASRLLPDAALAAIGSYRARRRYERMRSLDPSEYPAELARWYAWRTGKTLDLDDPKTFDEKLQWLKLFDATPEKGRLSDKYLVRQWVAERAGERYLVPLLGVWDDPGEIDFEALPESFVLKATHGCGYNIVVRDASKLDRDRTREKLREWLAMDYAFTEGLELQYCHCEPRVVAEAYLENTAGDLHDYKFFCFDGKAACIGLVRGRLSDSEEACFDRDWNKLPCTYYTHPRIGGDVARPEAFDEALCLAETLAQGFVHVRVDLYLPADGSVRFGEMTFTSLSGVNSWDPPEYDSYFGSLLDLTSLPAWKEMHAS